MEEIKSIQNEIVREEARLVELDHERDRLSRHIAYLKERLSSFEKTVQRGQAAQQTSLPATHAPSTSTEKVALFMELFCGRTDKGAEPSRP